MRRYPKRFIETLSENGPPARRMSDDKRIARLRLRFRPSYPGISACIRISKHVPILSSIGRGKRRLQREQTRTANASQSPEQPHHRNPKRPLQSDPSGRQSLCFGLLPGFRALDAGCQQNAHFVQRIERHDDQKQAEHVGRRNNGGYNSQKNDRIPAVLTQKRGPLRFPCGQGNRSAAEAEIRSRRRPTRSAPSKDRT